MASTVNQQVREELHTLQKQNKGILHAKDVVKFARNKKTALHKLFEWDDTEAAERYRILQAKSIIRVVVQIVPETEEKIRTFVSLSTDRKDGVGYRVLAQVMDDEAMVEVMLEDARRELENFRTKYKRLQRISEMQPVFEAIEKATVRKIKRSEERSTA